MNFHMMLASHCNTPIVSEPLMLSVKFISYVYNYFSVGQLNNVRNADNFVINSHPQCIVT